MDVEINGELGTETEVSYYSPRGGIQLTARNREWTTVYHTPAQARELAAALLRAADEAEEGR
ncbi:hypothetical protein [Streptomyces californicus]|uniref:hypothetical protein n=1 Tax=Streptomyces californicus TaxID=67351 RepID=UPI0004C11E84|nr:hypothetical protein [Streptomyces californicus]QRV53451.1 hypothetical protein I6J40_04015 [Streptomyces californicus]